MVVRWDAIQNAANEEQWTSNRKQEVDSYIRKMFESKDVFIDHFDQVLSFGFWDISQGNIQEKLCTVSIYNSYTIDKSPPENSQVHSCFCKQCSTSHRLSHLLKFQYVFDVTPSPWYKSHTLMLKYTSGGD